MFIRGINHANKPLRPYAYVGSLVKQETTLAHINFKFKAKLFSLDLARTRIVHDLNKESSRTGYRMSKNGQTNKPCKQLTEAEIRKVYDEPRRHLKEVAAIGMKWLKEFTFPDYTEETGSTQVNNGKLTRV